MAKRGECVARRLETETKANEIVIVNHDDWQGIYVDGKLLMQDHRLRLSDVLTALGIKLNERWVDGEWLETEGLLPEDLNEVWFDPHED